MEKRVDLKLKEMEAGKILARNPDAPEYMRHMAKMNE
jgi:hypothetical protein